MTKTAETPYPLGPHIPKVYSPFEGVLPPGYLPFEEPTIAGQVLNI